MSAWQVNAKSILDIDRVIEARACNMLLKVAPNGQGVDLLNRLHDLLLPHRRGKCGVTVQYEGDAAAARFEFGPEWSIRPSRELRDQLSNLLGKNSVRMIYSMDREMR